MGGGVSVEGHLRERTTDPGEAEEIIGTHYLGNRLELPRSARVQMELDALRIGVITSGRLAYRREVRQCTAEAHDFHLNMPVRGHVVSRSGRSAPVRTTARQALVFSPDEPADMLWSGDCIQLCLMIPRAGLEAELERLTGRSVRTRLRFDFGAAPAPVASRLDSVLDLVADELRGPTGLATSAVAGHHLEGLVLDGLLLGHRHNYTEAAAGTARRAPGGIIRRAVELLEERPAEPWTTVRLATDLHLSVRALQAGFRRELGTTPMGYLRLVRLRRAHTLLRETDPTKTTVQVVAVGLGLVHQGRFSTSYRALFGESPSQTLHR